MKKVLTIAGTDPTGGAGVQADLKTMTAHKVYGMSIITALVAQNTTGVRDIMEVTPQFLNEQFDCVFEDIYPDAIKIGMVSSPILIKTIVTKLKQYPVKNIVIDPVMVSTSGSQLLADSAVKLLKESLIPLASIITPNIPEAQVLTDIIIDSKNKMIKAAQKISTFYNGYILIKGGHFEDRADDLLYYQGNITWLESEKINNPNTHGTGCTLSSAIASNLAIGYSMNESVVRAKKYISGALNTNLDLGKGSGPLNHCWNMNSLNSHKR
ncbi:bifunctional hydroxymethylpyrimidine kinase/phosphomethylpyrimidine kinase [Thomasclavelia cocleata]|uniref:bifunctional hydroxymethylpyrimidine kinase/phosphomethylpyrimidine kinase n=1 Tax=Thomasclavelia cocleata TaxID=69824 RepID=UPI00242D4E14|nr:bifunctional hydroxymethylpyrimidine kinase/phosphomethylpyrimidine kinase [Thomasclavelia cocleata]